MVHKHVVVNEDLCLIIECFGYIFDALLVKGNFLRLPSELYTSFSSTAYEQL